MDETTRKITFFFDDFTVAFATFDGSRVASKFTFPYLARDRDGNSTVFHDQAALANYFQRYLDTYRDTGCVQCQYSELHIQELGKEAAMASVCWTLRDVAKATVLQWHESYVLNTALSVPLAFASIDHA